MLTEKSLKAYKKQNNYVSRLYTKERKMFLDNLNSSVVSDNRNYHASILLIRNRISKSIFQNLFCFNEVTKA